MEHFFEGSAPLRFWQVNKRRFLLFVILMKKLVVQLFFLKEDLHDVIDLTFLIFGSVRVCDVNLNYLMSLSKSS